MINEAKSVFEINVEDIYILVRESCVFLSCYEELELSGCSSFCFKYLLAIMQYFGIFPYKWKK